MHHDAVIGGKGGVRPIHPSGWIGGEEDEQANRVCAVQFNHFFGRNGVSKRLAHLRRTGAEFISTMRTGASFVGRGKGDAARLAERRRFVHHALAEEFIERFVRTRQSEVSKGFGHEARVNEVHLSVFNPSTVEIHLHPVVGDLLGKGFVVVESIGVP